VRAEVERSTATHVRGGHGCATLRGGASIQLRRADACARRPEVHARSVVTARRLPALAGEFLQADHPLLPAATE
jgi:hypothetical protein